MCLSAAAETRIAGSKPIIFSAPAKRDFLQRRSLALNPAIGAAGCGRLFQARDAPSVAVTRSFRRAPTLSRAEAQRLQKMQDERENWALMTPEEILGVDTSGTLSGRREQEAADGQKNLTVVERFLERQRQSRPAVTYVQRQSLRAGIFRRPGRRQTGHFNPLRIGLPTSGANFGRFFNDSPANNQLQKRKRSRGLVQIARPAPATRRRRPREQLAERERFKQLLDPGSYSDTRGKVRRRAEILFLAAAVVGHDLDQTPAVNPVGASFAPLNSGIGSRLGLTPLPGITGRPTGNRRRSPRPGRRNRLRGCRRRRSLLPCRSGNSEPRSVQRGDQQHLLQGGDAVAGAVEAHHAEGAHALADGDLGHFTACWRGR